MEQLDKSNETNSNETPSISNALNPNLRNVSKTFEHQQAINKDQKPESSSYESDLDENRIVRHIMVIGFHHKHGYQVDYCYPPIKANGPVFSTPSDPITLPSCWKTLPLLCLPDGSHNYDNDTIYFTMPDISIKVRDSDTNKIVNQVNNDADDDSDDDSEIKSNEQGIKTIFGTACYRQIQADKLLNRTDDMTRVAVQKSVCILSTRPLFGLIRSKLEMITHAYFEELDFSKVQILKLTYDNLNLLLARDSIRENATFLGLSVRHLISQFGCNVLVLFKAMLLEKKILFYKSPVRDLCSTIMSMCSLFTGLLEHEGLDHSTCDLQLSPTLLEALKLSNTDSKFCDLDQKELSIRDDKVFFSPTKDEVVIIKDPNFSDTSNDQENYNIDDGDVDLKGSKNQDSKTTNTSDQLVLDDAIKSNEPLSIDTHEMKLKDSDITSSSNEYEILNENDINNKLEKDDEDGFESFTDESIVDDSYAMKLCQMLPEEFGLPLKIFEKGSFCLPYLSISYLDLLADNRVRGFVIGATNFLFKQRREMYDIIVDMEDNNNIIINDNHTKKCLSLTIEDLRFMDYLSRGVKIEPNSKKDTSIFEPIDQDVTNWVGGDEWIRYHFKLYTLYLLKASKSSSHSELFNRNFVQSWKQTTNNYQVWNSLNKWQILDGLQKKHPFTSNSKGINFSDMKLKLSYAVSGSEKGRIVNQTLNGIGKWSIWNNLASAAVAATSAAAATATATANTAASFAAAHTSNSQTTRSKQSDIENPKSNDEGTPPTPSLPIPPSRESEAKRL